MMYRQIDATRGVSPCSYLVPSPPYRLARQSQATHGPDLRSTPREGCLPVPSTTATCDARTNRLIRGPGYDNVWMNRRPVSGVSFSAEVPRHALDGVEQALRR
ncbi:hypothetical protein NEOLEDRAFT_1134362 [Neolentinus lepideus HHB14362 ss-1]|uniref:Uncharacterized protein n=1 Tax=Neolentinus lepideus HHB14362 ss-1 TaxID=1314782 RepID=A0A165S713_9AGAM|nr:hypothetical protein NEOLEDRAFT_1134362 [Neolentinus lepideus HHB14362 ss-1]